jgi:transcriptional regulator with XRE-family HTH domain
MSFNGDVLYQLRLKNNMSRADLAVAIREGSSGNVKATERGIRGWEKGEYAPRGDALPAIAGALGCEIADLYRANGDAPFPAEAA